MTVECMFCEKLVDETIIADGVVCCSKCAEKRKKLDVQNFYFTFGSTESQPFIGGWVLVKAVELGAAIRVFRSYFPDYRPGTLSCAFVYSEKEMRKTTMYFGGNLGAKCHMILNEEKNG